MWSFRHILFLNLFLYLFLDLILDRNIERICISRFEEGVLDQTYLLLSQLAT